MDRTLITFIFTFVVSCSYAQYVFTPWNLGYNTWSIAEAAICPHCEMTSILEEEYPVKTESNDLKSKLEQEADQNGQSMNIVSHLADVYGPRLMGTKAYYDALNWSKQSLESWGADSVYFHSFGENLRGWELNGFSVEMIEPGYSRIQAYPAAYTSSTGGSVEGELLYLEDLDSVYHYKGKLENKVLLLGSTYRPARSIRYPMSRRFESADLERAEANPDPNHREIGYLGRRSINTAIKRRALWREQREKFFRFVKEEGVSALVEASDYPYGILHVDGNRLFPTYVESEDLKPIASFVFSNEHFGRLKRLLDLGHKPRLRLNLEAEFVEKPEYNQNLVAVLEGEDAELRDESVMLGGHFDSWHAGTGAVDNGSGSAIAMEAFRLLKALDLKMKRSVKLVLWGGHEQGFWGSQAYVSELLGNIETGALKQEAGKISAYFNLDNGAGRIRGIYAMGNDKALPVLKEILAPFEGQDAVTLQYTDQTDHELFDRLNVPAFQFIQDPLDYISAVHHTNLDLYEYVPEKDLKESAVLLAYLIYELANREELLPRKSFNSPKPSRQGNTTFHIAGYDNAREAQIIGTFNNWNFWGTPLYRTEDGWECKLELEPGEYLYKFYIDGDFIADPRTPQEELLGDGKGHGGLTRIIVR